MKFVIDNLDVFVGAIIVVGAASLLVWLFPPDSGGGK